MEKSYWIFAALVVSTVITGVWSLRNVQLDLIPEVVERGNDVTLRCNYERENEPLYSVKWYRGKYEFYRYSPSEIPPIKIFNIAGITVHRTRSNEEQVTITNVDYGITGNFSCEVTADAPTFSTEESVKHLRVVSLPKGKPVILTDRHRYDTGDTLKVNCSIPISNPPVQFIFKINTVEIGPIDASHPKLESGLADPKLQLAELSVDLLPLNISSDRLIIRCLAQLAGLYNYESEIQVDIRLQEPMPAQITSGAKFIPHASTSMGLFLTSLYALTR